MPRSVTRAPPQEDLADSIKVMIAVISAEMEEISEAEAEPEVMPLQVSFMLMVWVWMSV